MAACRQGDEAAWDALMARYERLVYTIPIRYGLTAGEVDDVFQTVWLLLLDHLSELKQPDRLSAWLVTTARRECWNRRRGADYERTDNFSPEKSPQLNWIEQTSPENVLLRYEQQRLLESALGQLQDRCRQLIWYLYQDPLKLSYEEIAENMKMRVGAIGPTRARCLKKLRQILEREEYE